jgi:hypothetical protein
MYGQPLPYPLLYIRSGNANKLLWITDGDMSCNESMILNEVVDPDGSIIPIWDTMDRVVFKRCIVNDMLMNRDGVTVKAISDQLKLMKCVVNCQVNYVARINDPDEGISYVYCAEHEYINNGSSWNDARKVDTIMNGYLTLNPFVRNSQLTYADYIKLLDKVTPQRLVDIQSKQCMTLIDNMALHKAVRESKAYATDDSDIMHLLPNVSDVDISAVVDEMEFLSEAKGGCNV